MYYSTLHCCLTTSAIVQLWTPFFIYFIVREYSRRNWRESRNTTRRQRKRKLNCWTNPNSQYLACWRECLKTTPVVYYVYARVCVQWVDKFQACILHLISVRSSKRDGQHHCILSSCLCSRFLYELSQIPDFAGRAHCIIFRSAFIDGIMSIQHKLNTVSCVCEVGKTLTRVY